MMRGHARPAARRAARGDVGGGEQPRRTERLLLARCDGGQPGQALRGFHLAAQLAPAGQGVAKQMVAVSSLPAASATDPCAWSILAMPCR